MPATEPKRVLILRAIKAALERIHLADDYFTSAGDHVFLGELAVASAEDLRVALPGLAVTVGPTDEPAQGKLIVVHLPVIIQGLVLNDMKDPAVEAEYLIADIKRALFRPGTDLTLGGLADDFIQGSVQPIPRERGSSIQGLQITTLVIYKEGRGAP